MKAERQSVNVINGALAVSTRPLGSTPWSIENTASGGGAVTAFFSPPAGKTTFALTSFTTANLGTGNVDVVVALFSNPNCTPLITDEDYVVVPPTATVHQEFPQPMVIAPGGSSWSLCVYIPTSGGGQVTMVGYYF